MSDSTRDKPLVGSSRHWVLLALGAVALAVVAGAWWLRPATEPTVPAAAGLAAPQSDAPLSVSSIRSAYTRVLPSSQRLRFFTPFTSYAGVDEVMRGLEADGYEPVLSSRHEPVPEGVPPNDSDIVHVANYTHLGVVGKLELQFFNDRLCQLEFEPADAERYREQFRAQWPDLRREQSGRSESVQGALRIASSLDLAVSDVGQVLQSRPFVLWQDLRLIRQRDDWAIQFAREAAK